MSMYRPLIIVPAYLNVPVVCLVSFRLFATVGGAAITSVVVVTQYAANDCKPKCITHFCIEPPGRQENRLFDWALYCFLPSLDIFCASQLEERQKGNDLYRAGNYTAAMIHYERALSIVKVVRGMTFCRKRKRFLESWRVATLLKRHSSILADMPLLMLYRNGNV